MSETKKYTTIVDLLRDSEDTKELGDKVQKHIAARKITKQLTSLRACNDLSQGDIAKRLGCSQSRISKLEAGVDDDLRLGDLDGYLNALGLNLKLVVAKQDHTIADEIKYHWHCLGRELDKLLDLAKNDPEIAVGIGKFSNEITCNYMVRILDFIRRLPAGARAEAPRLGLDVEDLEMDGDMDAPGLSGPGLCSNNKPCASLS